MALICRNFITIYTHFLCHTCKKGRERRRSKEMACLRCFLEERGKGVQRGGERDYMEGEGGEEGGRRAGVTGRKNKSTVAYHYVAQCLLRMCICMCVHLSFPLSVPLPLSLLFPPTNHPLFLSFLPCPSLYFSFCMLHNICPLLSVCPSQK